MATEKQRKQALTSPLLLKKTYSPTKNLHSAGTRARSSRPATRSSSPSAGAARDKADARPAVMTSTERHLSNQRLFNVTVTRVRDSLELFTDDRQKLSAALDRFDARLNFIAARGLDLGRRHDHQLPDQRGHAPADRVVGGAT